jgi:thermitase
LVKPPDIKKLNCINNDLYIVFFWRNSMKKLVSTLSAASLLMGLVSCNSSNNQNLLVSPEAGSQVAITSTSGLLKSQAHTFTGTKLEAEPGEILVALRTGTSTRMKATADRLNKKFGTQLEDSITQTDTILLKTNNEADTSEIIKKINSSKDADVQLAGPNYKVYAMMDINDPMSTDQYALDRVQARQAWDITEGDPETIIAIVDTGIDLTHPDLKDKLLPGFSALKDKVDDHNQTKGGDDNGHGTHCAGIAAGIGNNGQGISGMAHKNKVIPVRVLGGAGSGSLFSIAKGIDWAATSGAKVISMSLGGPSSAMDMVVDRAVQKALKNNVSVVAAMGNSGKEEHSVPACLKGVIAVGATDSTDKKASFSTWGDNISVSAPGVQILSTMPTYPVFLTEEYGISQNYAKLSGTSMATPAVSGIVGLLRSQFPNLNVAQVKEKLQNSTDDQGAAGFDKLYGFGRVNAFKAVSAAKR